MKVYVLTKGVYSDYSIVGVCSSKKMAESVMERFPDASYGGWNEIEEYELDSFDHPLGMKPYRVFMGMEGNSEVSDESGNIQYFRESSEFLTKTYNGKPMIRVDRWAFRPEDVIKIANEFRIKCKLEHGL